MIKARRSVKRETSNFEVDFISQKLLENEARSTIKKGLLGKICIN